jgi:ABC-type transporter Mla subunit MlaD
MTLSTELARLMDTLPSHRGDIDAYIKTLTALNRMMQTNLPAIIAALKAAETPMGDVAGLVERMEAMKLQCGPRSAEIVQDGIDALRNAVPELLSALRAQQHAEALAEALQLAYESREGWAHKARAALAAYRSVKP